MRAKRIIFAVMAISGSLSIMAQGAAPLAGKTVMGVSEFAETLETLPSYFADATFEVLLPSAMDPVVYQVTLQSQAAESDTLAPCDYVIRWASTTSSGPITGFSAYFDGNHYRFRNSRLQEYHAEANADPFMPLGPGSQPRGVQCTAQFADMLPQFLGARIKDMIADSTYKYVWHPDTMVDRRRSIVIDGVKRANGYDQMQYTYVFDHETLLPVKTEIESSPGSISEQIMTITYGLPGARDTSANAPGTVAAEVGAASSSDATDGPIEISEEGLMEAFPEVFERFRESTFKAENLVNSPLPAFSCRMLDSNDHYAHHVDETLASPTIIVVLDPSVSTTTETIAAIREAVDQAPMDLEVLWAFNNNSSTEISQALGSLRQGEKALTSANSLIRNCGITLFPTTILVDRASKVKDVMAGFNNDLGLLVLQKAMLLK